MKAAAAIEERLAQLEQRLRPNAERRAAEAAAASARAEAASAFDAVDAQRSELRDQHRAVLAKIHSPLAGLRKELTALQAIEQADYQPYIAQVNACQGGADRRRRVELSGSHSLIELLDRVELLVRETEASR
jgi:hypothetical protein